MAAVFAIATLAAMAGDDLPKYPATQPCAHAPLNASAACDVDTPLEARLDVLLAHLQSAASNKQRAGLLQNLATSVGTLSIAKYDWWNEALHGVAGDGAASAGLSIGACFSQGLLRPKKCATSFPAAITTASAFNTTLMRAVGSAIGTEARAFANLGHTGLTFWTPNVNIFRDPRWGRGQETPGEDPTLNADWAEHFVAGFQQGAPHKGSGGSGSTAYLQASACCKHFAAYSLEKVSAATTRHSFDAVVSQQDLQDTYFPAFISCANRGNASGVMCSYNAVNGVPSCASSELLTKNLRQKWGFNGYVTGDCGAVADVAGAHHFARGNETCALVLGAGLDSDCGTLGPINFFGSHLEEALDSGSVSNAQWERAARNLFRVQMRLGMFDPDELQPFRSLGAEAVDTPPHRTLALDAARQGLVLAKNAEHRLPFSKSSLRSIAVLGPHANATVALQSNYHGTAAIPIVSPAAALRAYVNVTCAEGCSVGGDDTSGINAAAHAAAAADAVVLVLGLDSSQEKEGHDRTSIALPGQQSALLEAVATAATAPIVLVIISGGPVDVSAARDDPRVGAILIAGYPGQSGGVAIAETLFGENNPSGKLTQTWYPASFTSKCMMTDMNMRPSAGCPGRTYRFYQGGDAVFQFGHGLSFTTFESTNVPGGKSRNIAANLSARVLNEVIDATRHTPHLAPKVCTVGLVVRNTGARAGSEAVLAFVSPPTAGVRGEPLRSLRRYTKVFIAPGESKEVPMGFTAHDFATVDDSGALRSLHGEWTINVAGVQHFVRVVP